MYPNSSFMNFEDQCSEICANIVHSSPCKREHQGKIDKALVGTFVLPIACSGPAWDYTMVDCWMWA